MRSRPPEKLNATLTDSPTRSRAAAISWATTSAEPRRLPAAVQPAPAVVHDRHLRARQRRRQLHKAAPDLLRFLANTLFTSRTITAKQSTLLTVPARHGELLRHGDRRCSPRTRPDSIQLGQVAAPILGELASRVVEHQPDDRRARGDRPEAGDGLRYRQQQELAAHQPDPGQRRRAPTPRPTTARSTSTRKAPSTARTAVWVRLLRQRRRRFGDGLAELPAAVQNDRPRGSSGTSRPTSSARRTSRSSSPRSSATVTRAAGEHQLSATRAWPICCSARCCAARR